MTEEASKKDLRICTKCKKCLPSTDFYPDGEGGVSIWCKICSQMSEKTLTNPTEKSGMSNKDIK